MADPGPTPNVNFSIATPDQQGSPEGENFAPTVALAMGGGLDPAKLAPAIAPLDKPAAQRIADYAAFGQVAPPTAPLDKPMPTSEPVQLPPAMRDEYSRALMAGDTTGPQHFSEALAGAAGRAAGAQNPPTVDDTTDSRSGLLAGAASGVAANIPSHEDLIDFGAAISHQALGQVTPQAVDIVKQNMLDHWADTGAMPKDIYSRALTDPDFRDQMITPPNAPLPPLTDAEHIAWEAAQVKGAAGPEPGVTDPLGQMGTSFQGENLSELGRPVGLEGVAQKAGEFFQGMLTTGTNDLQAIGNAIGGDRMGEDFVNFAQSAGGRIGEAGSLKPVSVAGTGLAKEAALSHLAVVTHAFSDLAADTSGELKGDETPSPQAAAEAAARTATTALRDKLTDAFTDGLQVGIARLLNTEPKNFAKQAITTETGIAERFKRAAANALDAYRADLNKTMPDYRTYIKDRQANYLSTQLAKQEWVANGGDPARFSPVDPTGNPIVKPVAAQLLDFVERRSQGAQFPADHPLYPLANALRAVADQVKEQMVNLHPEMEGPEGWAGLPGFVEDYYRHMWVRPRDASRLGFAKQGSGASFNARSIPTISEGIDRGLVPRVLNPIDNTLHYVAGIMDYIAAERIRQISRGAGHIKYSLSGPPEDGWMPLDGRAAQISGPNVGGPVQRMYAPPSFARVYNNWIGRGFYDMPIPVGDAGIQWFPALQQLTNAELGLKLGLSGFHMSNIVIASLSSKLASFIGEVGRGQIGLAFRQMVDPALGLVSKNPAGQWRIGGGGTGSRMVHAYLNPEDAGDPFAASMADLASRSGLRLVARGAEYNISRYENLWSAYKNAKLGNEFREAPIRFIANLLPRALDVPLHPFFDIAIPRLKASAWANEMESWLRSNRYATDDEKVNYGQYLTRAMDNRFGEMNQDMLFWRRAFKQTLNAVTVSLGWEYGTLRAAASGLKESAGWLTAPAEHTANMRYMAAYPAMLAAAASIYQYLATGTHVSSPAGTANLVSPRTGGRTTEGLPEHARIPSEANVFMALYHQYQEGGNDPLYFLRTRLNATASLPISLAEGKGWEGFKNDLADSVTPITWGDWVHMLGGPNTTVKRGSAIPSWQRVLGISPSSRYWDNPAGTRTSIAKQVARTQQEQQWIKAVRQSELAPK